MLRRTECHGDRDASRFAMAEMSPVTPHRGTVCLGQGSCFLRRRLPRHSGTRHSCEPFLPVCAPMWSGFWSTVEEADSVGAVTPPPPRPWSQSSSLGSDGAF